MRRDALLLILLAFGASAGAAEPAEGWALRPVIRPEVPKGSANPVDAFVCARLEKERLKPAPPADSRTLLRRVYFDLTGLPPSPEAIDTFAKNPTDAAYAKIVDDLMASPQYGERWARHWLDVARYGESDGFERNAPRPNAWHYRDWVVRSLNADMPYDRFARMQIAGDVLHPNDPDGVKATGFLVAGIHNTVLGSNKIANETARQDELEDVIATVGQTFLGLTVQCARCHDHKFDPVSQTDYYRLAAALGGVNHGDRAVTSPPVVAARKKLTAESTEVASRIAAIEAAARDRVRAKTAGEKRAVAVSPIARWSFARDATDVIGKLNGELMGGAKVERGRLILDGKGYVRTAPLAADLSAKTLEVWAVVPDLTHRGGGLMTVEVSTGAEFDSIVFGERQPGKWMAGSEFYRRTIDLKAPAETAADRLIHLAIVYAADGSITVYRDGQPYAEPYTPKESGLRKYKAGDARVLFGLRHTGGGNAHLHGEIEEARLYDRALTSTELLESSKAGPDAAGVSDAAVIAELTLTEKAERDGLLVKRKELAAKLVAMPGPEQVFATVPKPPTPTHILSRGSVEKKRKEVTAGGVECVPGSPDFGLKADAPDADRRVKLAEWIARPDNPLFARVVVNRLWQQHFGVGLVDTPSDFGANGGNPSHPELLDWLAAELVEQKFRLKAIHRLIVLSATYRQGSRRDPAAARIDADNRLLWRKTPTRLDAEAVRDAILDVSGRLDRTVGGPPYHDVKTYGAESGTTFYQPIDEPNTGALRRTLYRFSPRGERSAVLETFDCPDPSAQTPRRQVTTTPLQALALWNDKFVLDSADRLAVRVTADCRKAGSTDTAALVNRAYRLALGRAPLADERKPSEALVEKHGLPALGRVLFNSTEFVVIE